ncbi:nuclear transport factor 2 family protein [Chryseobacterium sp. MIQD13]|uniref:nuclear transport factor 2 family protein n=1 Tax=Chryseobacterium sp. MIQD13 TaxID=3422310 RepID=UPI003D26618C
MKKLKFFMSLLLMWSLMGCAQTSKNKSQQKIVMMDTNKITNNTAKEAFEAWQKGDSQLWLSFFTPDAKLLDDGNPRDFRKFSTSAIGHERFTSIDLVEDNGQSVYGQFHSDTWGNFRTYFKFHINSEGKIYLLEIGQA